MRVAIGCFILCALQLPSYIHASKATELFNKAVEVGTGLANTMEHFYQSKPLSKMIAPTFDAQKISALVGSAKTKVRSMVADTRQKLKAKDQATLERVAGAMGNSMKGLVGIVNGIKNGDWVEGIQGALGLVSAIAALAPPGIGTLISGALSAISTFMGLFGGSQAESEESMVKRVIETAISEFRNKDMKEDVEGVQHVYQSLSASIQQFRESGDLDSTQAEELYTMVFHELSAFGRLKARIAELCSNPNTSSTADTCIDFAKLYAELSILRQLIMTDLASLLSEPTIDLEVLSRNILNSIRKEQESDLKTFSFLGSPVSNPSKRLAFATMFGNPERYSTLISYLNSLHNEYDFGFWDDSMIFCTDLMLQGECLGVERQVDIENSIPSLGDYSAKSFFVPLYGSVMFWDQPGGSGTSFGPFNGPALYGNSVSDKFVSLSFASLDDENDGSIRFCEGESLNPRTRCGYWSIPKNAATLRIDLSSYQGYNWQGKVGSFYLPPGRTLQALSSSNKAYGTFVGPHTANKICKPPNARTNDWKTVIIERTDSDARSMIEYCDDENLRGNCFRSDRTNPSLKEVYGQCDFANKIRSIKIPAGYAVRGFLEEGQYVSAAGPYFGPVTIGKVDKAAQWKSVLVTQDTARRASTRSSQEGNHMHLTSYYRSSRKKLDWKEFDRNQTAALKSKQANRLSHKERDE